MKKLAFISDLIFTFFTSFLFTACFFRFLRLHLWLALFLSAVCGALTTLSVGAFLRARRKKIFLKKSDEQTKEKLFVHLALSTDEAVTEFFQAYLQKNSDEPVQSPNKLQLSTQDGLYFLRFRFQAVTADDVADVFRVQTEQPKFLLCADLDPQAQALCKRLDVQTRTGEQIYTALKQANALPQAYLGADSAKKRVRKFKLWFAKANARRFLTSAALILLVAQLTPFFYYYLIFSVLLLLSAVLIRVFGYE